MAKVTAPLLSFGASGTIAKVQTYAKWRGVPYARKHVIPANPKSTAQTLTRDIFTNFNTRWKQGGPLMRAPWDRFAVGQALVGRNSYMGKNLNLTRGDVDMAAYIGSPGAKGGLPASTLVLTTVAALGIEAVITVPAAPTGWTLTSAIATCLVDQTPELAVADIVQEGEDVATPFQVDFTGLTAVTYFVQAWLKWAKPDTSIAVAVAYSPPSADHVYTNKLLLTETLFSYLEEGYTSIPLFPKATVNVKPVYKLITSNNVSDTGIYVMPEWPGTPDVSKWTSDQRKAGYGPDLWPGCVYVQTLVMGPPGAEPSNTGCQNSQPSVLPSVDDFIHIKITAADMAHFATIEGSSVALTVGDVLILVGMHVTTREADRWTWQTFWWTATPHEPKAPSSKAIAKARPTILKAKDSTKHLKNAAGHYAMAVAYSMLSPAQPLIGGADIGSLVPAYNPHLEAGFGTGKFGLTAQVTTLEGPVTTDLGVQSNCMTCHGLAGYTTDNPVYAANYYVPRNDPALAGGLDLDFAWSILSVAKPK